jgi:predicted nucleic acid-binding protein
VGLLTLPAAGLVYVDAQIAIYTVDVHPLYASACRPLWDAVKAGSVTAVSSELTLMETLVGPLRNGDATRAILREALWQQANTRLLPITRDVLREAARLRALRIALKTPDALHAATALVHGCALFVTNDIGFRSITGLPLVVLDDVLAAP